MASTIKIKNSSTTGAVPTSSDLVQGELAINVTDRSIYTENASGTVVKLNAPSIDDKNTGATKHVTIDTSGNLGLGVTPSAWAFSGQSAFQVKNASFAGYQNRAYVGANNYTNSGGNSIYIASDFATNYVQSSGQHQWFNAASGTAGNAISFTQAMTLDASGNLGVGTTSPAANRKITVSNTGIDAAMRIDAPTGYASFIEFTENGSLTAGQYWQINKTPTTHALQFWNGSERARIDSSGNLLVGCTTTLNLTQSGNYLGSGTASYLGTGHASGTSSGANYTAYYYNATYIGGITQNGTTAVAYNTTSDYRLKENVQPLSGALARIAALKPCTYTWKSAPDEIGEGFIAHELAEVCPQAVTGEKDAVNEDGSIKPQSIDTSFLVATLTAAIQEQQALITSLTARITALEA